MNTKNANDDEIEEMIRFVHKLGGDGEVVLQLTELVVTDPRDDNHVGSVSRMGAGELGRGDIQAGSIAARTALQEF